MNPVLTIDFVSDVVCPWCAVGLHALETAVARTGIPVQIDFQPFELNPGMAPEGEEVVAHLQATYGISLEQVEQGRQMLAERGAAVGFRFGTRTRIWPTRTAHRLLHAAGEQDLAVQARLKHALLEAYHGEGLNPGDAAVLRDCAARAGVLPDETEAVLADPQRHLDAVLEAEAFWQQAGIHGVPAAVLNRRYLVSGGQPPEAFEEALRQAWAELQAAPSGAA